MSKKDGANAPKLGSYRAGACHLFLFNESTVLLPGPFFLGAIIRSESEVVY